MATDEGNSGNEIWHWTNGEIAQSENTNKKPIFS